MNEKDIKQLELEIKHIFDSGANELRIFEMTKRFIDHRNKYYEPEIKSSSSGMSKHALKELIEVEFDRCETISHFKKEVFRLIDLYDNDKMVDSPDVINYKPITPSVTKPNK